MAQDLKFFMYKILFHHYISYNHVLQQYYPPLVGGGGMKRPIGKRSLRKVAYFWTVPQTNLNKTDKNLFRVKKRFV